MKNEKEYLNETYRLRHALQESKDFEKTLKLRDELHNHYSAKHIYGFKTSEEIDQAVECLNSGKPDPNKKARTERLGKWQGILQKEWDKFSKQEYGNISNLDERRNDIEDRDDLDRE